MGDTAGQVALTLTDPWDFSFPDLLEPLLAPSPASLQASLTAVTSTVAPSADVPAVSSDEL